MAFLECLQLNNRILIMQKIIIFTLFLLSAVPAHSFSGISLDDEVAFEGACGSLSVKGAAFEHIGTYISPVNVLVTASGKTILNSDDIGTEHISINCLGEGEKKRLVIGANCMAHADVCGKTWYYIFNAKTGKLIAPNKLIAPSDVKSQKELCDAKCANKFVDGGFIRAIEDERYK